MIKIKGLNYYKIKNTFKVIQITYNKDEKTKKIYFVVLNLGVVVSVVKTNGRLQNKRY